MGVPVSAIGGRVTSVTADGWVLELTALSGVASAQLASRALGSTDPDAWTSHGTAMTAVAQTRTVTGLTEGAAREWRLRGPGGEDGQHGVTTPAVSIWETLLSTVRTALEGQGLAAAAIYSGRQPEPNYPDVCAVLRTRPERISRRANNVERVEFPVEVEIRAVVTDDEGDLQKAIIHTWQRRLEAALHEKHAGDFPGVAGLEEVRVAVETKDAHGGRDEDADEVRARAVVTFGLWRAK